MPPHTIGIIRASTKAGDAKSKGWQWRAADRSCVPRCGHSSRRASGLGVVFVGAFCRRIDSHSRLALVQSEGQRLGADESHVGVLCLHADTARMLRNAEITQFALETRETGMHGLRPLKNGKSSPKNWRRSSSSPGTSGSVQPLVLRQNISPVRKSSARDENSRTVQWTAIPLSGGPR